MADSLTIIHLLKVCTLAYCAGLIDSVVGGGGLYKCQHCSMSCPQYRKPHSWALISWPQYAALLFAGIGLGKIRKYRN